MRITSVNIKDFRSIAQLTLEDLGPTIVFYGQNGSGKSNIIAAIQAAFRTMQGIAGRGFPTASADARPVSDLIRADDFRVQGSGTIGLGITLEAPETAPILRLEGRPLIRLDFRVVIERRGTRDAFAWCSQLTGLVGGVECDLLALLGGEWSLWMSLPPLAHGTPPPEVPKNERMAEISNAILSFLTTKLDGTVFRVVADVRHFGAQDTRVRARGDVLEMLAAGDIKGAFATAHQHESAAVRDRFAELRRLLSEELSLPAFDPVRLPNGEIDVQTRVPGGAVSIDLSGLGVLQIFYILASIALSPAAAVAIEEPEAHLHARTSGRALRKLLMELLEGESPMVEQLFVATHSNLFDLDREGYRHVTLGPDGTTQVQYRTELVTIDRDHLWEPGPARHALEDVMRILPEETVVAHRPDGRPVTAEQMIHHLQIDDEVADQFCQDVIGAAVRAVRVRAKARA